MNKVESDNKHERLKENVVERPEKDKMKAKFSLDDFDVNREKKDLMKDQRMKRKSSFDINDWINFPIV
jgi:hypothetical protein